MWSYEDLIATNVLISLYQNESCSPTWNFPYLTIQNVKPDPDTLILLHTCIKLTHCKKTKQNTHFYIKPCRIPVETLWRHTDSLKPEWKWWSVAEDVSSSDLGEDNCREHLRETEEWHVTENQTLPAHLHKHSVRATDSHQPSCFQLSSVFPPIPLFGLVAIITDIFLLEVREQF